MNNNDVKIYVLDYIYLMIIGTLLWIVIVLKNLLWVYNRQYTFYLTRKRIIKIIKKAFFFYIRPTICYVSIFSSWFLHSSISCGRLHLAVELVVLTSDYRARAQNFKCNPGEGWISYLNCKNRLTQLHRLPSTLLGPFKGMRLLFSSRLITRRLLLTLSKTPPMSLNSPKILALNWSKQPNRFPFSFFLFFIFIPLCYSNYIQLG